MKEFEEYWKKISTANWPKSKQAKRIADDAFRAGWKAALDEVKQKLEEQQ